MKRFTITQNQFDAAAEVEINFDFIQEYGGKKYTMDMIIKDLVEYWSGWKLRLILNDGNYTVTFLKDLMKEICLIYFSSNCTYNIKGIIGEFENKEGYCKMDGSMGIKIVNFTYPDILDDDYYEVESVTYSSK